VKTTKPDAAGTLEQTGDEAEPAKPAGPTETPLVEADEHAKPLHAGSTALEDTASDVDNPRASDTGEDTAAPMPPPASSDLSSWLAGGLRSSPSKSVPPAATPESSGASAAGSPETLAPQVMDPEQLDDEDLAVLPGRGRSKGTLGERTRGWVHTRGRVAVAALGALTALLAFGYTWWQTDSNGSHGTDSPAAQTPAQASPDHQPPAAPSKGGTDVSGATNATDADQAAATNPRRWVGAWAAPASEGVDETDAVNFPGGPSVARFPDLPAEFWSELRRKERQQGLTSADQPAWEGSTSP
jgi:hypothetical protein